MAGVWLARSRGSERGELQLSELYLCLQVDLQLLRQLGSVCKRRQPGPHRDGALERCAFPLCCCSGRGTETNDQPCARLQSSRSSRSSAVPPLRSIWPPLHLPRMQQQLAVQRSAWRPASSSARAAARRCRPAAAAAARRRTVCSASSSDLMLFSPSKVSYGDLECVQLAAAGMVAQAAGMPAAG